MSEHRLALETRAAQVLKSALMEVTDDPDAIADTIEGETNLHEAIAKVMAGIDDDEAYATGLQVIVAKFNERRHRIEARIDRRRNAIERAMVAGEITKLELPQATLSMRRVAPKLQIVSEALIPENFWLPQPPKLDRAEVSAAIKAGREVPGALLDNGSTTLTIRRA